jgi:hypothetical protein
VGWLLLLQPSFIWCIYLIKQLNFVVKKHIVECLWFSTFNAFGCFCSFLLSRNLIRGLQSSRRRTSLLNWLTILIGSDMLMSLSSWVTVQSMAKGFWSMSIAAVALYKMHYTQMMNLKGNFPGMPALGWHLELLGP